MTASKANIENPTPADLANALEELQALVVQLEEGELDLEDSLKRFERGIKLTHLTQKMLQEVEQRVNWLTESENLMLDEEPPKEGGQG